MQSYLIISAIRDHACNGEGPAEVSEENVQKALTRVPGKNDDFAIWFTLN